MNDRQDREPTFKKLAAEAIGKLKERENKLIWRTRLLNTFFDNPTHRDYLYSPWTNEATAVPDNGPPTQTQISPV